MNQKNLSYEEDDGYLGKKKEKIRGNEKQEIC